ncbi:MAG: NUDIX domain-containing protein [Bacteroidales bacterium]|nr:NUDIX domain-containing protein [Bacteroidales bacterium]
MSKIPIGLKRAATICILRHGDKFLLLKRFKEPNKDKFTPVGGKLDPFESPLNSAIRETFEETGISVKTMKYCGILTETSPTEYNWTEYVYIADIDFISPPDCNEGTLEWISFHDLLSVPTPKTDWHIYKYILDEKPFAFSAEYNEQLTLLSMTEEIENVKII